MMTPALQRDEQCHACGSYFDEEFSSGTDTEAEVDADDWSHYQTVDVGGDFKSDENKHDQNIVDTSVI